MNRRIAFAFGNFHNYWIRAVLKVGLPNWRVLGSIVVRTCASFPARFR
jgi:hypothetical protein